YLPYNLGLLYQRLNRRKDAQAAYRKAIELAPDQVDGYNALGALEVEMGHPSRAEHYYNDALTRKGDLRPVRHNKALLMAKLGRRDEALGLWKENIAAAPDYLPSRIALGEELARAGKPVEAEA